MSSRGNEAVVRGQHMNIANASIGAYAGRVGQRAGQPIYVGDAVSFRNVGLINGGLPQVINRHKGP